MKSMSLTFGLLGLVLPAAPAAAHRSPPSPAAIRRSFAAKDAEIRELQQEVAELRHEVNQAIALRTPEPHGGASLPGRVASAPRVWVNTRTGSYHYPGDRWYGTTQQGQYMTETQAQAQGYHSIGHAPGPDQPEPAAAVPSHS